MNKKVGVLNKRVIELLNLKFEINSPIYIGESNINHIKDKHPEDFKKYGDDIEKIIKNPTYIAKNPKQGSIEYIKEYKINKEFVLVAVRISNKGNFFVKTLFQMSERKKEIYLGKGYAKIYDST